MRFGKFHPSSLLPYLPIILHRDICLKNFEVILNYLLNSLHILKILCISSNCSFSLTHSKYITECNKENKYVCFSQFWCKLSSLLLLERGTKTHRLISCDLPINAESEAGLPSPATELRYIFSKSPNASYTYYSCEALLQLLWPEIMSINMFYLNESIFLTLI